MILVLGHDTYEQGTDPVITWLLYHQVPFLKVTLHDLLYRRVRYYVDVPSQDVIIDGVSVRQAVSAIWYRRFTGPANELGYEASLHTEQLSFEVRTEIYDLLAYLELLFQDKPWLTTLSGSKVNKLTLLAAAQRCGLRVPRSRVLNNQRDLLAFYQQQQGRLISKPIADVRDSYVQGDNTYLLLTNELTEEQLAAIPAYFFPTLFQERVAVATELRVFYLDGRFFATAMLIGEQGTRSVDRKLDNSTAHAHYVPYQLPPALTGQLTALMQASALVTGCLDLLLTEEGEYIFLEVNPIGQYLAESNFCNYAIEKEIADWLLACPVSCTS